MALPTYKETGGYIVTTSKTTHTQASQTVASMTDGVGFYAIWDITGSNSADFVTGVTWGGVPMTRVASIPNSQPYGTRMYLYALPAPTTGTTSMVATTSASRNLRMWWFTVEGAAQQQPEASGTLATINSSSMTPSVTTLTNDSLVVGIAGCAYPSSPAAAYSGTTIQNNDFNIYYTFTSPQVTAGSNTSGVTSMSATTDSMGIVAAVAPLGGGGGGYRFNPQLTPFAGL